jgi:PAS domain S-box-containing protein
MGHGFEEPGDLQDIRFVVDTIPTLAWSAGPDGSADFFNQRWLDYTGLSAEQALGSGWQVAIHPEDLPRILETYREALNSVKPFEVEGRFRRSDGEYRWFLFRGSPLLDRSGKVSKWYGTNTDLEERKRAEDALRASEASLLYAQRLTRTCSWRHEVLSDKVTVSPEGLLMYGIQPGDDASSPGFYFKRMHPKDRPEVEQAYAAALLKKTDFEADFRIVRPDGTIINTRSIGHPILNEHGDVVEFVGASIDVTEHHRAAQALRRSEAYLAEAQRLAKTGSWAYNPAAEKAIYWSHEMLRMFGLDPQRTNPPDGEEFLRLMHPEDRDRFNELYERSRIQKTDWIADYRIVLPDGAIKHLHVVHHPVLNESGDLVENFGTAIDVTEQAQARIELEKAFEEIKQRTEAARRSERELRDVVNTVPAHVWSTSPDGQVDFVNDRWLQFTGLSLDDAFGWKWEAVLHPDDRTRVVADWHTAVKNGQAMESEARVRRADGEYCWWFIRNVPLRDETGKLVRWYGTAIDIEDRKRAEQGLRKSEAYLAEAQRLAKTGSWAYNPAAEKCIYWSDEMLRIFGLDPRRNLPDREEFLRMVHPEDRDRFNEGIEKSRREKSNFVQDYRIVLTDGTVKHIHGIGHPVLDETGNIIEYVGTDVDVTERKLAEEKLRRSEADLLEGQRLTHSLTWKFDVSSRKVTNTPEANRIYGFKGDEDTSDPELYFEMIHPDDRKRVRELFERCTVLKINYEADYAIILPDGNIRHIHATGHPVLNESGDLVEWVGTTMDVTEQAQARIELEKAFEEIKRLKDRLHDENLALREQIDQVFMFEEIVGSSPALQTVLSSIVKVAPTDSTVLITGETGTGKELIARAIHKHSQRSGQAFISVNCGSIPSGLIGSELFGHERGAFTGALQRRQGRFELAHSGTIFLDEIGELPAETQIALLRVLQERQFERVGGNRPIPTDARVIAATNRDLKAAIASGVFRSDLFYRLNVFPIHVPPLRNRKEDIPMLVEYFVKRYAEKARKQIRKIEKNTLELCRSYPWPGNIRELQNIIERSVIFCTGDTFWIDPAWLSSQDEPNRGSTLIFTENVQNYEKQLIEAALAESNGKIAGPNGAAGKLGIPRSTLDAKIKQLKINK